jgi:formylglycine-generating enzyme required for sulfatase activity
MRLELTTSNGVRLIRVIPGSFLMGSPLDEAGREFWDVAREVTLSDEFYFGATPVTQ